MSSPSTVEIAIALVWREGLLLLSRRRAEQHLGGLWEFPGGKCLPGETPGTCAEREVLEELGVACRARGLLPAIEFSYPERTVRLHPVECDYVSGEPAALQVAEWTWCPPSELERYPFPPANSGLVRLLQERGKGR